MSNKKSVSPQNKKSNPVIFGPRGAIILGNTNRGGSPSNRSKLTTIQDGETGDSSSTVHYMAQGTDPAHPSQGRRNTEQPEGLLGSNKEESKAGRPVSHQTLGESEPKVNTSNFEKSEPEGGKMLTEEPTEANLR